MSIPFAQINSQLSGNRDRSSGTKSVSRNIQDDARNAVFRLQSTRKKIEEDQSQKRTGFISKTKGAFQDFEKKRQQGTDIFSRVKQSVQKVKDFVFGEDIVEDARQESLVKIAQLSADGKDVSKHQDTLKMITKIEDPNTDDFTKKHLKNGLRLDRYFRSIDSAFLSMGASLVDSVRLFTDLHLENQRSKYEALNRNNPELAEKYKQLYDVRYEGEYEDSFKKGSDGLKKLAEEHQVLNPNNSERLASGVGSMFSFAIINLLTGSASVAGITEALTEGGSVYGEERDKGTDPEESIFRASGTFGVNLVINKFLNIFDDLGNSPITVKRFFTSSGTEFGQEFSQTVTSNIATDKPPLEGALESGIIGAILGGGMTLVYPTSMVDMPTNSLPTDPQILIDNIINTDFAKTAEGKKLLKTTVEAQKQGKPLMFNVNEDGKTVVAIGEQSLQEIEEKTTDTVETTPLTEKGVDEKVGIESKETKVDKKVAESEKVEKPTDEVTKSVDEALNIDFPVIKGETKSKQEVTEEVSKTPSPTDRGEVAPGKDVKKVDAQSKRGEDGLVVGDIKPTREISNLVDGFSSSEKQIKKLEDILSLTSAVDDPKKFNKIEGEIDKIETGNRNAVKQISKKLNVSEFEVTTALSEFIDIGSRRGKTTLTDFYNFFRKDIAVKETPKEKTQREEGLKTKTDAKNEVAQSLTGELKSSKRGEEKTKPEVKNGIETLPKDVSVDEEAKAVGAKRIAPDRTVHQQLTPTESIKKIKSSISESIDILDKSRPVKASKNVIKQFNDVEVKVERGTATEAEKKWHDRVKDQMKVAKAYAELKELVGSKDIGKTELLEKARAMLSNEKAISNYYIKLIKKDISKGYKFPEAVISYDRSFTKAENNRARYEKGLATSFSADDSRIVFDDRIVGGLKRQDGNIITKKQIDEIVDGILQTQEALGIDMNKIAKDERWVYAHLNGKNPFLTAQAGGLYRKGANNISISIGGVEGFWTKVDGKKVRKKVNTTIAHELGHALDYHTDLKLFSRNDLFELRRGYNPVEYAFRGDKYWSSNVEITARAIEQYVAIENGHEAVYEREAYWKKEVYDSKIKPMVKEAIDKHFSEYQGTPITPEKIKQEVAPVKEEVVEKPVPKKELDKLEEKIVEQKEPEVKPKEKPKKKYEAQEPGQIKASKVAVSIEQKLGEKLENIAGFESINIKDQLKKAEDLLNKNLIRARGMISGKIPLPDGLRAGAFVVAVEEYAKQTNDMSLLRSLAVSPLVSETSIHAQELRLLAERDRDSVLSKMQEIANERAKVAERKYGSKVDKLIKEETKKVKESIKKVDKHLWKDFLKNIEC